VTTGDGNQLLDSARLTVGAEHNRGFFSTDFATGSLASWRDPAGTRWVLAPAGGRLLEECLGAGTVK
jgi:hypothetical protein